ncbi:MAG: DUF4160 domain-containing protein, partial [Candidatus Aminicenantes bacterium]|nr:DUF4160 domain-containing protein [Candidatus Aminicenantes bacterium]
RFYGIVIYMFSNDHNPPHFHARYGEFEILVNINNLSVLYGKFPSRALGLTIEWASLHQKELKSIWERLKEGQPSKKVKPLK